jgi:hypothetical protein
MSMGAALVAAGFNPTVKGMEQREGVAAALKAGREQSIQETGITRKRVIEMLEEAYRSATTSAEMVMAARELGKLLGFYEATKVKVTHELTHVKSTEQLKTLTLEELERLADQRQVIDGEFVDITPGRHPALIHGTREDN